MRGLHGLSLLAAACVFSAAASAEAQAPPPAGHDAAVAEFRQGRRLIDAGDCAEALHHLEESLAYEASVGARLSIVECIEKAEPLRAWRLLVDAALLAYSTNDDRVGVIESRLDALEHNLPMIVLVLARSDTERAGLEVSVDGKPLDRFLFTRGIAVAPGPHQVDVHAPGKSHWSKTIAGPAAGAKTRVFVELDASAPVSATPTTAPLTILRSDPRAARRTVGLSVGAMGLTAIAVGAVFGVLALSKRDELDNVCGGDRGRCAASPALVAPIRDNASTLAAVSTVSFVVGGVAVASGVALYLWPSGGSAKSAARVRVAPALGNVQGLTIEGPL